MRFRNRITGKAADALATRIPRLREDWHGLSRYFASRFLPVCGRARKFTELRVNVAVKPIPGVLRQQGTAQEPTGRHAPLSSPCRCRRQTVAATEAAVEVGEIVETAGKGDIADAAVVLRQQICRLAQPQFGDAGGEAGAGLEQQFVDIALREAGGDGKFQAEKSGS